MCDGWCLLSFICGISSLANICSFVSESRFHAFTGKGKSGLIRRKTDNKRCSRRSFARSGAGSFLTAQRSPRPPAEAPGRSPEIAGSPASCRCHLLAPAAPSRRQAASALLSRMCARPLPAAEALIYCQMPRRNGISSRDHVRKAAFRPQELTDGPSADATEAAAALSAWPYMGTRQPFTARLWSEVVTRVTSSILS